ncbi:MAG: ribosomal protein S18-alanine N-acetyltransferase [Candidatus Gastranaerophilales bacterium]|nr:ribosomal protein S18-alanine N-acetyltransferase [Candidatus Gastranaerophilales bacterium]
MQKVKIIRMQTHDVDEVFSLEELVHPNHHWSKDSFYNELANQLAHYYCIKDEKNKILGYIGFWQILEESHITTLAVHPEYRNIQLAQILMIQLISDCYRDKVKYITLEVRESNIAAISLYEKFLFESIGMRKNYYQDNGENALIMFTQNIWYDTFKDNFKKIKDNINKVQVLNDK